MYVLLIVFVCFRTMMFQLPGITSAKAAYPSTQSINTLSMHAYIHFPANKLRQIANYPTAVLFSKSLYHVCAWMTVFITWNFQICSYNFNPYFFLFFVHACSISFIFSIQFMTRSVKTRHNRLNFQYKALIAMGEILAYFKKYYGIFLNAWFIEKETSNNTNLDIIWFTYSRGVWKSLFCYCRTKDTPDMGVCLRNVETILRNRFFLIDFAFVCSEERWYTEKLTQYLIPLFMVNMMVQIVTQYILLFVSYHRFSIYL